MKKIYNDILIDTLIQFEKENTLSTKLLCSSEMNNEIFSKIYEKYINNFDMKSKNDASFSRNIKIKTILGLSYPFILTTFFEINNYTNTLVEDYYDNDYEYRNEEINEIETYFNNKNNLETNLEKEFKKKYFINIFENNNTDLNIPKLKEILFNDYIMYYLSKSNNNFYNKNILIFFRELFKLFLSRKEIVENDEENNNKSMDDEVNIYTIKNISKFVLFIESYKSFLHPLCKFIYTFDLYINNFIKDLTVQISLKIFKSENEKISYVNDIFFNIFESVNYCIINSTKKFDEFSDDNFNNFLNELKLYTNNMTNTNIELRLTLKQILYLYDFFIVKDSFYENGINLKKYLQKYLDILKKEDDYYLMPKYIKREVEINENEQDAIEEEFLFLKELLSKGNNYLELITKLINNKIKVSKDEQYRINILKILFSNNLLNIKNINIFEIILRKYELNPINEDNDNNEVNQDEENNYEIDDEINDKGDLNFLLQLEEDKEDLIIEFINKNENKILDEIFLSLFDVKFAIYFEKKKNNEDLIFNQSFEIFKKCINYIEKEKCKISKKNKIGILYCISYIKYYCYYFSKVVNDEKYQIIDKNEIYSFLNNSSAFRKVIKIYILKVLNLIFIKNYHIFLNVIEEKQIFFNDFDFVENVPCALNYLFLENEKYNYYKDMDKKYILFKMENYRKKSELLEIIDNNFDNFICFYDLMINEEISNLITNFNQDSYNKLSHFLLDFLKKFNLPEITKDIISLYYSINKFKKSILPSLKNLTPQNYEILLYSHKLSLIASLSKKESIYSKIYSPKILDNIKNLFIPGGEPNDSLKIEFAQAIDNYFKTGGNLAVYMCSCYSWYLIGECGGPKQTYNCTNCGQIIGGNDYVLYNRPGHIRILKEDGVNNAKQKSISQLMAEVEREKNYHFKGFKKVKFNFFINPTKKVRKMNNITYRILSFVFYSCIYYCEKLGYIKNNDLINFYFIDGNEKINDIFFILKQIWEILIEELLKREVNNIQCFLNMIIPELTKLFIETDKKMENNNEREEFEKLCDQIIENAISNYKNYFIVYINNNKEILEITDTSIKSILQETSNITNLPENSFPLFQYFYAANYPSIELFFE